MTYLYMYLQVQRVCFSLSQLEMALTEKNFRDLAHNLGQEWERLATELGMNSSEIFQIKQDYQGVANQIFQMLIAWQQKQGTQQGPARQSLLDALRTVQRNDLAETLGQMQGTYMHCGNKPY